MDGSLPQRGLADYVPMRTCQNRSMQEVAVGSPGYSILAIC
jgi:hypothetical protein